MAGLSDVRQPK